MYDDHTIIFISVVLNFPQSKAEVGGNLPITQIQLEIVSHQLMCHNVVSHINNLQIISVSYNISATILTLSVRY